LLELVAMKAGTAFASRKRGFVGITSARPPVCRICTGFVESTVDQVISKRFCKEQQMAWAQRGVHLLQIRTRVLNGDWEASFREWYPGFRVSTQ
jgi:hypothetical protein